MKVNEVTYNVNDEKKGFYYDYDLLGKIFNVNPLQIEYVGSSKSGNVYLIPNRTPVVVIYCDDYNKDTGTGTFKYRDYSGDIEKLNKSYVKEFESEYKNNIYEISLSRIKKMQH